MNSTAGKVIITIPVKVIREIEKARQRHKDHLKKFSQIYGVDRRTAAAVISCRDPNVNHYVGQRYPEDGLLLATENWKSPKQDGDCFTIRPHHLDHSYREEHSFDEAAEYLSKPVLKAMREMGFVKMSPVQRKAFGPLVHGSNVFVGAETGSGKTIAFLAPIIERLLRLRKSDGEPAAGAPRAIVLSPTRELSEQLMTVSRQLLTHTPPVNAAMIRAGDGNVYASELDRPGYDLLIATVGAALRYRNLGALNLRDLRHVVVDEADTSLSESMRDNLYSLLKEIKFNRSADVCGEGSAQLILVASLCPDQLQALTNSLLGEGGILHLTADRLHRLQPYLHHRFIRMSRKFVPEALLTHAKDDYRNNRRVAVFTSDAATCEWVEHFLQQSGVPVVALRGTMPDEERRIAYQRIMDGEFSLMVATDAATLGLDTRYLARVINYQVPQTIGGYLRRAGRLGRLGCPRTGAVTTFITNYWEVDFAQELEQSVRLNLPLSVNDIVEDRRDYEE